MIAWFYAKDKKGATARLDPQATNPRSRREELFPDISGKKRRRRDIAMSAERRKEQTLPDRPRTSKSSKKERGRNTPKLSDSKSSLAEGKGKEELPFLRGEERLDRHGNSRCRGSPGKNPYDGITSMGDENLISHGRSGGTRNPGR